MTGPDGIHTSTVKGLRYEIAELLTAAGNLSLKLASAPKE